MIIGQWEQTVFVDSASISVGRRLSVQALVRRVVVDVDDVADEYPCQLFVSNARASLGRIIAELDDVTKCAAREAGQESCVASAERTFEFAAQLGQPSGWDEGHSAHAEKRILERTGVPAGGIRCRNEGNHRAVPRRKGADGVGVDALVGNDHGERRQRRQGRGLTYKP